MRVQMKDSISVIIPAFNEQENIAETVALVSNLTARCIKDFEIIIVNDGSTDDTGTVLERLERRYPRVRIVTHPTNLGLGKAYLSGIAHAEKTYVTGYPADNDQSADILTDLILARKKADMVVGYMTNLNTREFVRKVLSVAFSKLMNLLFGLHLKYYNGYFICRVDLLKKVRLKSAGFTLFAEAKIRLIKKGISFIEIPYETKRRVRGKSKALRWKNIWQTIYSICVLLKDVYITHEI